VSVTFAHFTRDRAAPDRAALDPLAYLLDRAGRKDAALSLRRLAPDLRRCDPQLLRLSAALVASVLCPSTTEPTA